MQSFRRRFVLTFGACAALLAALPAPAATTTARIEVHPMREGGRTRAHHWR